MSATEWVMWQTFLTLSPQGAERADINFAGVREAVWNSQIAKTKTPKWRSIKELLIRFGDAPDPTAPTRSMDGNSIFDAIVETLKRMGAKPKNQSKAD